MSSSQLTLSPSFFRGVGGSTTKLIAHWDGQMKGGMTQDFECGNATNSPLVNIPKTMERSTIL